MFTAEEHTSPTFATPYLVTVAKQPCLYLNDMVEIPEDRFSCDEALSVCDIVLT